ncbi:MAG: nuclear transport factor 2 family protein [Verrucomicrobiota bacterium]|nr:nuclear transport factor 2 family protein [Verrucomicrobiota bacterium]
MTTRIATFVAAVLIAAATSGNPAPESAASRAEHLIQAQVEAYNRHDLDAFLKFYAETIQLYDFPDQPTTFGLEQMRERYAKRFGEAPNVKANIAKRIVQGDFVIDHEELTGLPDGKAFKAVAIYQVSGDRI